MQENKSRMISCQPCPQCGRRSVWRSDICPLCGYTKDSAPEEFYIKDGELVHYNGKQANVTIPDGVTALGDGAFGAGRGITALTVPASVTHIEPGAVTRLNDLIIISVAKDNPVYRSVGNCIIETGTGTLIAGCKGSVIPDDGSVIIIGDSAFLNCNLTDLVIPDGVVSIEYNAFSGCELIKEVFIPASVTNIDAAAFAYCGALEKITVDKSNPVYHSAGNCIIETETKTLIASYKNSVIPSDGSVEYIGVEALSGYGVQHVVIPQGVAGIDGLAFCACRAAEISIPASVTEIGFRAFERCQALRDIHYSGTRDQWRRIAKKAFCDKDLYRCTVHCADGDIRRS